MKKPKELWKTNQSTINTIKKIKEVFCELYNEMHDPTKITIKSICERANINRGTFYLHFNSINDLSLKLREDFLHYLFDEDMDSITFEEYFNHMFDRLTQLDQNISTLICSKDDSSFFKEYKNKFRNHLIDLLSDELKSRQYITVKIEVAIDGLIEQYIKIIRKESTLSLEELRDFVIQTVNYVCSI